MRRSSAARQSGARFRVGAGFGRITDMQQLWLAASVVGIVTGFGLLVAVTVLQRLAPVKLPPILPVLAALLVMGVASVGGVYLDLEGVPGSVLAHRLVNAAAWAAVTGSSLLFLLARPTAARPPGRAAGPVGVAALVGLAAGIGAFRAAHPPAEGLLYALPAVRTTTIAGIELGAGVLAVLVGLRALSYAGGTASRPWRSFLRGLGIALLLLVPANLLDFGVSTAVRSAGGTMQDGFIFAVGYGLANLVLIVAIVRSLRISGTEGESPAVPQAMMRAFGITRRERDVIEKLLEGKSDREIAEELYISPRTVDTHLRTVFRKCSVRSRLQLTRLVYSYGELRNSP
jgi:DNA-binding CsgD family transcriptional regulator